MSIEDEIQTSLNNRDRKIMKREATIREQAEQLQQKEALLSKKDEQLSQKDEQLRTSILMLLSANFPVEVIAQNLNVSEEDVRKVER